jgi:hypothetical protein
LNASLNIHLVHIAELESSSYPSRIALQVFLARACLVALLVPEFDYKGTPGPASSRDKTASQINTLCRREPS